MNNKNDLDNFNIFELMGLTGLSQQDKEDFLSQMESNIWIEFLALRLNKILPEDDLAEVSRLVEQGQELNSVISFIESKVPNFKVLLFEFTREEKINIIKGHFETMAGQLDELDGDKIQLKKLRHAISLVDQNNWVELKNLWIN